MNIISRTSRTLKKNIKHQRYIDGEATTTYKCWSNMKSRCYNTKNKEYRFYGAVGVTVCDRWVHSYDNFVDDMGERPEGLELDKDSIKKGNLVYCKEFCCWITQKENAMHRKTTRFIDFGGMRLTQSDWSRFLNFSRYQIKNVLKCKGEEGVLNFIRKNINRDGFKANLVLTALSKVK